MATLEDLEIEIGRLRRRVRELSGATTADSRSAVNELVSSDDERLITAGGSTNGFGAACARSDADLAKKLEAEAIRDLRAGSVRSQEALRSFHRRFERLGHSKRLALINEFDRR